MKFSEYQEEEKKFGNSTNYSDEDRPSIKYLSLKNNKDSAKGFFLTKDLHNDDYLVQKVHHVKLEGDKFPSKIMCLNETEEDTDCPICSLPFDTKKDLGLFPKYRAYLPFYNLATQQIEVWERGATMIRDIESALETHNDVNETEDNISDVMFVITRNGKAGSTDTTYAINAFPTKKADRETQKELMENLDRPDLIGQGEFKPAIFKYSFEGLTRYVERRITKKENANDFGGYNEGNLSGDEDIPF